MNGLSKVAKPIGVILVIGLLWLLAPECGSVHADQPAPGSNQNYFQDGNQIVALEINGTDSSCEIYLRNNQPFVPIKYLAKLMNLTYIEKDNQLIILFAEGKKYQINIPAKTGAFLDRPYQPLDLIVNQNEIFVPLLQSQEILGIKANWDPQSMTIILSYTPPASSTITIGDQTTAKPGEKFPEFQPISGIDLKFDRELQNLKENGSIYNYNENRFDYKTIGSIFGGDLIFEGYFDSINGENYEHILDKFLWDKRTPQTEYLVGSVYLAYPQLIAFNNQMIGFEINNSPSHPVPTLEIGSELLGAGQVYYQVDQGNNWRYSAFDQQGTFSAVTLNYGLNDMMNIGGSGSFLYSSGFQHNIYMLTPYLAFNQRSEIKGVLAMSTIDNNTIDKSDQSWNLNYHWKNDVWDIFADDYTYGRYFYPYNSSPVDLTGQHLGAKYTIGKYSHITGSYHQYTNNSLSNETDYSRDKTFSTDYYTRLSPIWDWDTQINASHSKDFVTLGTSYIDTTDGQTKWNQKVSPNWALNYLYHYNHSRGTNSDDNLTKQQLGWGTIWNNSDFLVSIQPSYYWISDNLGGRNGYEAEFNLQRNWANEPFFQTRASYDYYHENGGENRNERTETLEFLLNLTKDNQLTLGASRYTLGTDTRDSRDTKYYLTLNCGFGYSQGKLVNGISPNELGVYGAIVVTVFNDTNHNGIMDPGENIVSGITVTLDSRQPVLSDYNGQVVFKSLQPGIHQVDFDLYALDIKYSPTVDSQTVDIMPNVISRVNLGIAEVGSISGVAFVDQNGDGKFNSGDEVLAGTQVTVDGKIATTTDNNGNYYLKDLSPGKHRIELSGLPDGISSPSMQVTIEAGKEITGQNLPATKK